MANAPIRRSVRIDESGADDPEVMGQIDPAAEIDADKLIKAILNVIDHEVKRLIQKSNVMVLDLQESKLLESYLRAILAADERLQFGKRKMDEDEAKQLSPEEIRRLLKEK